MIVRPFRLAFTLAPSRSDLAHNTELTRWLVLQKARCHPDKSGLQLFVSIWFQILFHLPHRDTFHLSLTVLVRYRSSRIFSLGVIVTPDSNGISPVPPYLRINSSDYLFFRLQDFHFLWWAIPGSSARKIIRPRLNESVYLATLRLAPKFRLFRFRSPLLTESQLISLPPGTKMFQFPGCASLSYLFR